MSRARAPSRGPPDAPPRRPPQPNRNGMPFPTTGARQQAMSRRFVGVWHNPPPGFTAAQVMQLLAAVFPSGSMASVLDYAVVAYELGNHESTPHFHMYFVLSPRTRTQSVLHALNRPGIFPGIHIETAWASDEENRRYTLKEGGDSAEYGEMPTHPADLSRENNARAKDKFQQATDLARNNQLDLVEPAMLLRHYAALKQIANTHMPRCIDPLTHQAGLWIWGPRGTRKTSCADAAFMESGGYYSKDPGNKWWDGYQGQALVLLDEMPRKVFMSRDVDMAGMLKTWAGHLPFKAEVKGGVMEIRPSVICVTANFPPEEVLANARVDLEPILKRFRVIHVAAPGDLTPDGVIQALSDLPPVVLSDRPAIAMPEHIRNRQPDRIIQQRSTTNNAPPTRHPLPPSSGFGPDHVISCSTPNPEDGNGSLVLSEIGAESQVVEISDGRYVPTAVERWLVGVADKVDVYLRMVHVAYNRHNSAKMASFKRACASAVRRGGKQPAKSTKFVTKDVKYVQTTLAGARKPTDAVRSNEGTARILIEMDEDDAWRFMMSGL